MVGFDVVRFLVMAREVAVLVLVRRGGGFVDYDVSGLLLKRAFIHRVQYRAEESGGVGGIDPGYRIEGFSSSVGGDAAFIHGVVVYRLRPVAIVGYIALWPDPYVVWVYVIRWCRGDFLTVGSKWCRGDCGKATFNIEGVAQENIKFGAVMSSVPYGVVSWVAGEGIVNFLPCLSGESSVIRVSVGGCQ